MLQMLARRWWALALRGTIAVLFGLLTLFIQGVTLISLVMLFGFYAILDGVFERKTGFSHWTIRLSNSSPKLLEHCPARIYGWD